MGKARPIDVERVRELFVYDLDTGLLRWRKSKGRAKGGKIAGGPDQHGYRRVGFDGERYFTHRIVWAMTHESPDSELEIDHIDGDHANNRMSNLRLTTPFQNQQNITKLNSANTSGVRGVRFRPDWGLWVANMRINKRGKHLGRFATQEEAQRAYDVAERLHRPFAQVNTRTTIHVTFL